MPASVLTLVPTDDGLRDARHDARRALRSRVWDPAGRALLEELALPTDARVLEAGPGHDPLDEDALAPGSFDLVHARFELCLLGRGRGHHRLDAYRRLLGPGGVLVVEEPDTRTWALDPYGPATAHLVGRLAQVLHAGGGDLDAGRRLPALMRRAGLQPRVRTHTLGLEAGHPYLRLPLDLADAYAQRLTDVVGGDGLAELRRHCAAELATPGRGGTTFTLVQAWARV